MSTNCSKKKRRNTKKQANYGLYELYKSHLSALNLSPDEYYKRLQEIARRCGV